MHQTQKILLKRLLLANNQKYSSLTSGYNYEDNVVFHLKQLIYDGFVEKKDNIYTLTVKGVKEITAYDISLLEDTGFKTFFIGFLCEDSGEYLLKEHLNSKNNFYNLPSGKPRFGEHIDEALVRTFFENTGLKLQPENFEYLSLHLKTIKTSDMAILFDDAFVVYKVIMDKDLREKMKLKEEIKWFPLSKIKSLPNRWPEIDLCILNKDHRPYLKYEFNSDYILD